MHVLNNTVNKHSNSYNNINSKPTLAKPYLYCKDINAKPCLHEHIIYARKIELLTSYFPKEKTIIKQYLFDLYTLTYNLQNPELLIKLIVNKVKQNVALSELPLNFSMSVLGIAVYNFIYKAIKNDHNLGEYIEPDQNKLSKLVVNSFLLTLIQTSCNLIYKKFQTVYYYTYAIKGVNTDNNSFLLKTTNNKNFTVNSPFKYIDIAKIISVIIDKLNYSYNEVTALYKLICLSLMELWIENNYLAEIEDNTDTTTRIIQKIITLIIKNNLARESILFNKEMGIQLKQAIDSVECETGTSQNDTSIEQENTLNSIKAGCYSVLNSNLVLYIKKSSLGHITYKIYHPLLQLEVISKSKDEIDELFTTHTADKVILKKIN